MDKKLYSKKQMATCILIFMSSLMHSQTQSEIALQMFDQGSLTDAQLALTIANDPDTPAAYKQAADILIPKGIYNHGIISDVADVIGIGSVADVVEGVATVFKLNPKAKLNEVFIEIGKQTFLRSLEYSNPDIDLTTIKTLLND